MVFSQGSEVGGCVSDRKCLQHFPTVWDFPHVGKKLILAPGMGKKMLLLELLNRMWRFVVQAPVG